MPYDNRWRLNRLYNLVKRFFDGIASLLGLILLTPFFGLIALLIRSESPGPVFYRSLRAGRRGKNFHMLKFRTMRECPESYSGPPVTAQDDPRVTPLGHWLRGTKLNELPQLWNVLKGEMSLVGPRPEDPQIVAQWPEEVRGELLAVRPGITSPASVLYRQEEKLLNGGDMMNDYLSNILPDKLRLDRLYLRNRSLLTDLDIIFLTLIALLPRLKRIPIPESLLIWGPLSAFASRYFSWFLADSMVAFSAVAVSGVIWRIETPLDLGVGVSFGIAVGIALLFSIINSILGLGRVSWRHARPALALDLALSSGLVTLSLFLLDWFWPSGSFLPPGMLLVSGLLAFLGFLTLRYRARLITGLATRWLHHRGRISVLGERVLIVGAGECGQLAAWLLQKSSLSSAFSIVGMVDDDPRKQNLTVDGCQVLGLTRDIPGLVEKKDIGLILFAISKVQPAEQARILSLCRQTPARLVIIPDLLQILQNYLFQPGEKVHDKSLV